MVNKKLTSILLLVLALAGVGVVSLGARQQQSVRIPPGAIVESPNARSQRQQLVVPDAPALPSTSSPVAFQDDFASNLSNWQSIPSAPATWGVRDGRLQQWGNTQGEPVDEPAVLSIRNVAVGNGRVEAYIFPTGGDTVGIAFRGSDAGYYRVELYPDLPNDDAKAILTKVTPNGGADIASTPVSAWAGYKLNTWQRVTVDLAGSNITVSVDGKQVLSASDSSFSSGWAGVWTLANTGAQFDNVRIQPAR